MQKGQLNGAIAHLDEHWPPIFGGDFMLCYVSRYLKDISQQIVDTANWVIIYLKHATLSLLTPVLWKTTIKDLTNANWGLISIGTVYVVLLSIWTTKWLIENLKSVV